VPDITASPAVDVALGLIFLFVLLSLICSTINEMIAGVLSWRSRFLEEGIRSMLAGSADLSSVDGLVKQLAAHPLIQGKVATPEGGEPKGLRGRLAGLRKKGSKSRVFPSYLNKKTFSLVFLDTFAQPELDDSRDVLRRTRGYVGELDADSSLRRVLISFLDKADGNVDRFRESLESWYDLTMDRVSGWYKRRTQFALIVIATIVTLLANADSLQIGKALWNDDAVRASVVAQAQRAVDQGNAEPDVGGGVSESAETLSDQVADVSALELPLGWSTDPDDPRWFDDWQGAVGKVLGLIATVLALTLGAPFWFDLLGKVSRIRTSGKPERTDAA
jgi:hypothetical protein